MSKKQDVYKYLGTVASLDYASNIIRLWDYCGPCEKGKPPMLLYASVGLLNYLKGSRQNILETLS